MEETRIVSSMYRQGDSDIEYSLRPKTLDEYVGQEKVKSNLKIFIEASKKRGEPLDHVLLYGPPGLGKTTLSHIVANELGVQLRITSGPSIEHAPQLTSILTTLSQGDVLFIDEIHRLNHTVEEILYPAMEDGVIDVVMGKGPGANTMRLPLPPFTLIGATTRAGMLTGPLRDRFGVICRLEMYKPEELACIVKRSAGILKIAMPEDVALEIARRSRGTPRIANRLLKRVRDFADVKTNGKIDLPLCREALKMLEVDDLGLDNNDRKYLEAVICKFAGGPVGLDTIASAINEDSVTIEDIIEPYLLQLGFIAKTPRGRVSMPSAAKHLGLAVQPSAQQLGFDEG